MTPDQLVADLRRRGVELRADGSRLRWKALPGCMTAEVLAQLTVHKPAILRLLAGGDRQADHRRREDDPNSETNQRRALYAYARGKGFPAIASPSGTSVQPGESEWRHFAMHGSQDALWDAALMLDDVREVAA